MSMQAYDLIVVGAGMVGLGLAAAASKIKGLRVVLWDQGSPHFLEKEKKNALPLIHQRFSAINPASEQFLRGAGAWKHIIALGAASPYRRIVAWDATGQGEIEFNSQDLGLPYLGHIVSNQSIQRALYEQLSTDQLLFSTQLESLLMQSDSIGLSNTNGQVIFSKLLVGADGASSWVRQQAGFSMTHWPYRQCALTAIVETSVAHQQTAWQCFLPSGPLAFLPLADPYCCSIVWSTTEQQAQDLSKSDLSEFNQQVSKALGWRLGDVQVLSERSLFPLHMSHVKRYIKPRLALLGDAAHTLHPLAGQGLNLGLRDAKKLVELLSEALQHGCDISDFKRLRCYERACKADNWEMILAVEGFKRLFSHDSVTLSMLRNTGMTMMNRSSSLKRVLMRKAMGI